MRAKFSLTNTALIVRKPAMTLRVIFARLYGNMLKEFLGEFKLTQKEVAEKLGRDQSYIARVERGKADIQF